jgi:hypothetical protein
MTPEEVAIRVKRDIGENWEISNAHGVDLRRCLVTPEKRRYEDISPAGETVELWLVLEEDPILRNGYKIVYGESRDEFGLAMRDDKDNDIFLGYYGDFLTTFDAM